MRRRRGAVARCPGDPPDDVGDDLSARTRPRPRRPRRARARRPVHVAVGPDHGRLAVGPAVPAAAAGTALGTALPVGTRAAAGVSPASAGGPVRPPDGPALSVQLPPAVVAAVMPRGRGVLGSNSIAQKLW